MPAGDEPVAPAAGAELDVTAPAERGPRNRRRQITEGAWYLFFVTGGALAALLVVAWLFGYYKRQFLEDSPLAGELFDARARAEIERHRREVQAERAAEREPREATEQGGEPPAGADGPTGPPHDAPSGGDPAETETDARSALAARTDAAPDPAARARPERPADPPPPAADAPRDA